MPSCVAPRSAATNGMPVIKSDKIKMDWYEPADRAERDITPPGDRLANPFDEIDKGVTVEQAIAETARCFSCGLCFGCDNCWMYCQNNCFKRIDDKIPGALLRRSTSPYVTAARNVRGVPLRVPRSRVASV